MTLTGGKRKVNKSLKAWVAFVKKVQKEEKLSYKDAIHRAKVRKDKGEKWMKGGNIEEEYVEEVGMETPTSMEVGEEQMEVGEEQMEMGEEQMGGRRRRKRRTMRRSRGRSRGRGRGRTMRRGRSRSQKGGIIV